LTARPSGRDPPIAAGEVGIQAIGEGSCAPDRGAGRAHDGGQTGDGGGRTHDGRQTGDGGGRTHDGRQTGDGGGRTRDAGRKAYVGRFAPSPTGALHLGSLVAALGSFLDARRSGGRWLVRIEDLDTARVVPGCSDEMLRTLERFGLHWDGEVEYQSRRIQRYVAALETLKSSGLTFECSCSRRERSNSSDTGYPGTCRGGPTKTGPTATRFRVPEGSIELADVMQGSCKLELRSLGDPVMRRRDGVFSYQLAVVVDDAQQDITDVVRGSDLLESTGWQLALQGALGLATPRYSHLPLVVEPLRGKLSKSRHSLAVGSAAPTPQLIAALQLLQHPPPAELLQESPRELLAWATNSWQPQRLRGVRTVTFHTS
jgi:glutamyl-Q tRNA(Asp) synthetase